MKNRLLPYLCLATVLIRCSISDSQATLWKYTGAVSWTPQNVGNTYPPNGVTIPMEATVTETPTPQISIKIYSGATGGNNYSPDLSGTYDIFRKDASDPKSVWGAKQATITIGASNFTWVDTNVVPGAIYEYGLAPTGTTAMSYGFLVAGIKGDQTQPKGRVALVVSNDVMINLPAEYAQYKADLIADGWFIHEIPVTRAKDYTSNGTGALDANGIPTAPFPADHIAIRNQIIALYQDAGNQYPNLPLRNVILLGKVPVVRSGLLDYGPDGHGNVSAVGADAYYADMDGVWTDTQSNFQYVLGGQVSGFTNNADGSVTPPTGVVIDATFLKNLRTTFASSSGYTLAPDGKYIVYASFGNVYFAYKTFTGYTNNPDGTVTLPRGVIIDQTTLKNDRALGSGTFFVSNYMFIVSGGNVTSMACTASVDGSVSVQEGTLNVPGDNKFDADYMDQIRTASGEDNGVELGFGRIDLSNAVPAEYEALRMYFNKEHRYKTASPDFQPARKAIQRAGFGTVGRTCVAGMANLFGMGNVDWIDGTDLPGASDPLLDTDSEYTRLNSSALFYFKGGQPPGFSDGGRAVFWTGMQSHWGYWYASSISSGSNVMQLRLGENNFTLSFTWAIGGLGGQWDTSYLYHRMGMGFDVGDMMRISMSARGSTGAPNGLSPVYSRAGTPLFMAHMGDPTLRLYMFAPPSGLSVAPSGGNPSLTWTASPEPTVTGYHIYRAANAAGPFTRLTNVPVAAPPYVDTNVSSGAWNYMVRAVRLEATGGGTFYNASLGIQQGIDLTNGPAALQISTATLPSANWNTPYQASLIAQGGTPLFTWTIDSGSLPPGLNLAPNGTIAGTATAGGIFPFVARATDALNQTITKPLSLTAQSNNTTTFYPEVNTYAGSFNTSRWASYSPDLLMSGPAYSYQPFLRFNIASLNPNNGLVRAKLILTLNEGSQASSYALAHAVLTQDAGDGWTEASLTYATRPLDNITVPQAYASTFPVAYGTFEFDVTALVQATLTNDPAKKVGLRLYTTKNNSFGSEVRIATRLAAITAKPRLVIETTNAPAITFNSPSANAVSINVGSSLLIQATAVAIPAQAGALTVQWSKFSGPGTVTFGTPNQASTTAAFSAPGDYVLRLTANDGLLTSTKDLTVHVASVPAGTTNISGPAFDPSLILRLPFDENTGTTTADVVGGHTATLSGLTSGNPTWVASGKIGAALNFVGTGQRVEVVDSAAVPLDGMQKLTASLWVYLNAADANAHAILVKQTSSTASTMSYAITMTNAEKISVNVAGKTAVVGDTVLNTNQWYHVVMIYDGSLATNNLQLYINGNPDKFGNIATGQPGNAIPKTVTTNLRVGDYYATAATASFNGQVDEVRLYNRALSLDEIQVLANEARANVGPLITLASTASGNAGQPFALAATVTDDGIPSPLSLGWTLASGPGGINFGSPTSASTTATAATGGAYVLRLSATDGAITTFADVRATITGTAYQQWLSDNNLPPDGSGNGAPNANPSGDGVSNAMKFALGLAVNSQGYAGRLSSGKTNVSGVDYLSLTYTRPEPVPSGVGYLVKTSPDLTNWSAAETVEVANDVTGGLRTITVRDSMPMDGTQPKRFIHLEVTVP